MQIRIFTIPITDSGTLQDEMNAFLSAHRVLEVEQKFSQNENGGYWTFCVRYILGSKPSVLQSQNFKSLNKKDYRDVLSPEHFAIFTKLRAVRKELAAADGSPPYVIFTDAELAEVAVLPEITEKALRGVQGFGEKKFAKYGKVFIEKYNALPKSDAKPADTAAEPSAVETSQSEGVKQ